jgi:hypothetical protein
MTWKEEKEYLTDRIGEVLFVVALPPIFLFYALNVWPVEFVAKLLGIETYRCDKDL